MTAPNVVQLVAVEEARIQRAYAHRRKQGRDRTSSWSRPAYAYDMQDRERKVLATLQRLGVRLAETRVLEVGCGTGAWIRDFVRWGAAPENIRAIDLLPECVVEARQRCAPGVHLQCCSAASLPFADSSFDLVLQATMFSSILEPAVRRVIAAEMLRVAGSSGVILWYDLSVNNPWNANVRGIGRAEVKELFPGCRIELQQISLAPPLARWIAPWSHQLWVLLASVPWLCTHFLCVIHPWRST